jgi:hypothetical protein
MRFHRLSRLLITLLLAASLPLRVYAAPCESPGARAAHHGTHCEHRGEHGAPSGHGAACDCCSVAVAAASPNWALPHDPASAVIARLLGHSPILTLDRLDRPPRLSA